MPETEIARHDDGRWSERQIERAKLNGTWTVFYANGQKEWERQHVNDRKEGYSRHWDVNGRLVEEEWYHLNELHGRWRQWDEAGREKLIGDFYCGYSRKAFDETANADFNALIKPFYDFEPERFAGKINEWISSVRRKSVRLRKLASNAPDFKRRGSFWNHVNLLGKGEQWPHFQGSPLHPILQINCADISLADNPLTDFSFLTLFAAAGDVMNSLGEDIVIRAYRPDDELVSIDPPCDPLDVPRELSMADTIDSIPDENDLPPGLKILLNDIGEREKVLSYDEKLNSRIGGWPGWLQGCRISSFNKFAFQVDSLEVENWDCGDCTIHYFFLNKDRNGFSWTQEMC